MQKARSSVLRHLVSVQSPSGAKDAYGERVTSWSTAADMYSAIEPLSVTNRFLAAQQEQLATHKITLRYQSEIANIDNSWRIVFGSRVFTVVGPMNEGERNREIVLLCLEGKRNE